MSTLFLLLALGASAERLPIIADDLPAARAEATARKLPLFVDVWAPW